jgi:hypothetical protein
MGASLLAGLSAVEVNEDDKEDDDDDDDDERLWDAGGDNGGEDVDVTNVGDVVAEVTDGVDALALEPEAYRLLLFSAVNVSVSAPVLVLSPSCLKGPFDSCGTRTSSFVC